MLTKDLGPLILSLAVAGPVEGGTSLTQSYVVGGYIRSGMEQWAPRVDRVLDEQLQRLKSFVEGKSPAQ